MKLNLKTGLLALTEVIFWLLVGLILMTAIFGMPTDHAESLIVIQGG